MRSRGGRDLELPPMTGAPRVALSHFKFGERTDFFVGILTPPRKTALTMTFLQSSVLPSGRDVTHFSIKTSRHHSAATPSNGFAHNPQCHLSLATFSDAQLLEDSPSYVDYIIRMVQ